MELSMICVTAEPKEHFVPKKLYIAAKDSNETAVSETCMCLSGLKCEAVPVTGKYYADNSWQVTWHGLHLDTHGGSFTDSFLLEKFCQTLDDMDMHVTGIGTMQNETVSSVYIEEIAIRDNTNRRIVLCSTMFKHPVCTVKDN